MDDESSPIGPMLDALGVTASMEANQQVTEAVVVCKISDFETGTVQLGIYLSDGLDWIAQRGLLTTAVHVLDSAGAIGFDDDDD